MLNFPATGDLVIAHNLQLREGAFWYQPGEHPRHGGLQANAERAGPARRRAPAALVGTLARHTAELAAGLEALEGQELVALYRDHNGQVQLVGTPEQPLSWKDSYDSGLVTGRRNNYDWTLAGETPRRARPYLGSWDVSAKGLETGLVLQGGSGGSVEIRDRAGNLMARVDAGHTVVLRSGFRVAFTIS
ncbi:hypothetical protein ACFQT0_19580 [Hymenobacter humi]|uniref:Uncharacterized protein n=1 Tax=Hymenobacter humi TaxID=1411620 RepID=A0ABW2UB60_9BACT